MHQISIIYELDNAIDIDEKTHVINSLRSIIHTCEDSLVSGIVNRIELILVVEEDYQQYFNQYLEINQINLENLEIMFHKLKNISYFKKKSIAAKYASHEILLFLDSDCIYEKTYIKKMLKSIDNNKILYGRTYALPGERFENEICYVWQFQSTKIKCHFSHQKNSHWGNNFCVTKKFLETNPFILIEYNNYIDLKIDRYFWERKMISDKTQIDEVDALAFHPQPKNLASFMKRFFIHGMASRGIHQIKSLQGAKKIKMRSFFLTNRLVELLRCYLHSRDLKVGSLIRITMYHMVAAVSWHLGSQYMKLRKTLTYKDF